MRIFLDTNVVLDTILPERKFRQASTQVMDLVDDPDNRLCISSLSVANIWYIARKYIGKEGLTARVKTFLDKWKILSVGDMDVWRAVRSSCSDFEDALQISCAEGYCDVIVTADKKHFESRTALPVFTPEEFMEQLRIHNGQEA